MAILTLGHWIRVWEIVCLALFQGFVNAFDVPTRQAMTVEMVGKEDLRHAISLNSMMFNLARVVGPDVAKRDGGPISFITGAQGVKESVAPPNNNGYERTLCWTDISQAVTALTPFVDRDAAEAAGFSTERSYKFRPFTPTLPNPLGDFVSFSGC